MYTEKMTESFYYKLDLKDNLGFTLKSDVLFTFGELIREYKAWKQTFERPLRLCGYKLIVRKCILIDLVDC